MEKKIRIYKGGKYQCVKRYGLGGGFIKGEVYSSFMPETLHDEDGDNMHISDADFDEHFIDITNTQPQQLTQQ